MDPIANMLTAIRNAQAAKQPTVTVSASKVKTEIARILKEEGYIESFQLSGEVKPVLTIELRYNDRQPAISHIRRISKPGLRVYVKRPQLPRPLQGIGLAILSTPAGIVSDTVARRKGVGGEVICEVW